MRLHLHHLTGCTPTPLAFYLKALGILRLVGEQKDRTARGWWQDEHFCLLSTCDRDELEAFFLNDYSPTPFVSPWLKGSGFYAAKDPALASIETSVAPRFEAFRRGIAAGRLPLADLASADAAIRALKERTKTKRGVSSQARQAAAALKHDPDFKRDLAAAERKFKILKGEFFEPCLRAWRGRHREWMDAALVAFEDGRVSWPSLLGTGGNDGRLDFTNNAMKQICDLFELSSPRGVAKPESKVSLKRSLWALAAMDLSPSPVGQFFPGAAGGANSSNGADGDSLVNPWDFILMLEGALCFSSRITRRLDAKASARASAPFSVRSSSAGQGTAGHENAERGEQWMPLWSSPVDVGGIKAMFGEARLQLGRQVAGRPVDAALAITRLGTARGVTEFVRFAYLERNGQSTIAVPLGRVAVRAKASGRLAEDLVPWMDRLQRLSRDQHAPGRLVSVERRLANAVFGALTHDETASGWQEVLLAALAVEELQSAGTAISVGPIPRLSPDWVRAADDGSVEWRLAIALGSAAATYYRARPVDSVRHHWLPLKPGARQFQAQEKRLVRDARVVAFGRDALSDLSALVGRRLVESSAAGERHLPMMSAPGGAARLSDVAEFVAGRVDVTRTWALARALMAVRWDQWGPAVHVAPWRTAIPPEAWMALRLGHLPWPLGEGRDIFTDTAIVRRLESGDGASAMRLVLRRLRACGMRSPIHAGFVDAPTSRLWAAGIAFPVSHTSALAMAGRFEFRTQKEIR